MTIFDEGTTAAMTADITIDDVLNAQEVVDIAVRALGDITEISSLSPERVQDYVKPTQLMSTITALNKSRDLVVRSIGLEVPQPKLSAKDAEEIFSDPSLVRSRLVMAAESDSDESKSIIATIIDAIIDALRKLYDMIIGVFKKEPSPSEAEKSGKKAEEAVKEALEKNPIKAEVKVDKPNFVRPFAGMNENFTLNDIAKCIETSQTDVAALGKLITDLSAHLKDTSSVIESIKNDQDVSDKLSAFDLKTEQLIRAVVKESAKSDEIGISNAIATTFMAKVSGIAATKGTTTLYIWKEKGKTESSVGSIKAKLAASQEKKATFTLNPTDSAAIISLFTSNTSLYVKAAEASASIIEASSTAKSTIDSMLGSLKQLSSGTPDNAKKSTDSVKEFVNSLNSIGRVISTLTAAVNMYSGIPGHVEKLILHAIGVKGKASENDKPENKE